MQEPDPFNTKRPETVKLHIPVLGAHSVKGGVNTRYPVGWTENGLTRKGFFTLSNVHSVKERFNEILQPNLTDTKYTKYRDFFLGKFIKEIASDRQVKHSPGPQGYHAPQHAHEAANPQDPVL